MAKYLYRIEHYIEKVGPYNHMVHRHGDGFLGKFAIVSIVEDDASVNLGDPVQHKAPWNDRLEDFVDDSFRFGFRSLAQLKKWFGTNKKVYEIFEDYGMVLRRYTVSARFDGGTQSVAYTHELKNGFEISFEKLLSK